MSDECHTEHKKIADAVAKVSADLSQVSKDFEYHSAEQHAQLMPRSEAKEAIEETKRLAAKNAENVRKILDELLGEYHPLSGERKTERGLSHKVDTIWRQSQNGGVQAKLTAPQKTAIWTAAIGGVAAILTALVQVFGASPPPIP